MCNVFFFSCSRSTHPLDGRYFLKMSCFNNHRSIQRHNRLPVRQHWPWPSCFSGSPGEDVLTARLVQSVGDVEWEGIRTTPQRSTYRWTQVDFGVKWMLGSVIRPIIVTVTCAIFKTQSIANTRTWLRCKQNGRGNNYVLNYTCTCKLVFLNTRLDWRHQQLPGDCQQGGRREA